VLMRRGKIIERIIHDSPAEGMCGIIGLPFKMVSLS
jgi:hypothetical protein